MNKLRYIFTALLLAYTTINVAADDFTELPAADYPIGDELPIFTTQMTLGGATDNATSFKLEYPEYAPLTATEIHKVKQAGLSAPEEIKVEAYMAISRKVRVADISFCPIICRNGKWMRLISAKITPMVLPRTKAAISRSSAAERYAENSVLSSGKWVKIKVDKEGIYELTASALAQQGFNDLSRVKIYGYGGRILPSVLTFSGVDALTDDLEEVATFRKNGSILFFAEGTTRWKYENKWLHEENTYSKSSYYFITEGENPLQISTSAATTTPVDTLRNITHNVVYDNDAFGWYGGGTLLYDSYEFTNGSSHSYKLNAPDIVEPYGTLQVAFSGSSATSSTRSTVSLNGSDLGTMTMPAYGSNESAREVGASYIVSTLKESNSVKFSVTTAGKGRLNFVRLTYKRALKGSSESYSFTPNTSSRVVLSIAEASENTQLWRIAYTGNPTTQMQGALKNGTLTVPLDNAALRYVIADVSKSYPAPEFAGSIENQNLHADRDIDMVIIIPESGLLETQAERLAAEHAARQNLRVKIVKANQIYNEFSSGTPDATAYRRYMKMLYDRADDINNAPRYLLLFGDGAWDNRMVTEEWAKYKPEDFLLCFEKSEKINDNNISIGSLYSFVTDDYFGLLDDNEGSNLNREKIDLGIGRFPVHTADDAKLLVDKTIAYMDNKEVGRWKNTVYFLGDNGDGNEHMNDAEKALNATKNATGNNMDIQRMYWDAYPRSLSATGYSFPEANKHLKEILKNGAIMFNYSGHGSPDQLSHSRLLTTEELRALSNAKMPLWALASCEITPFDEQRDDIGRATLINKNGGAIALFCASRAVYASYNNRINSAFCSAVFGYDEASGERNSLGDAIRKAKVGMIYDSSNPSQNIDHTMNKLKYVLLGDPAVTLSIPTGRVVIDSINGKAVSPELLEQLPAGSKAVFSGHIVQQGSTMTDSAFSGLLTATLYDREETVVCRNNDGSADDPMTYTAYTNAVSMSSDSIKNGRFSIAMPVPVDISYSSAAGKLMLYAVNNDHTMECNGFNSNFCLNGTSASISTDKAGPELDIYLNAPGFLSGGTVGTSPLFIANIKDESGINAPLQSVGHDMELTIDDDASMYYVLNQSFSYDFGSITSGTVNYQLENLPIGTHNLLFRAWDTAGNSSSKSLTFVVSENYEEAATNITATNSPAIRSTRFIATFNEGRAGNSATFEVFDLAGRLVWSETSTSNADTRYFSAEWYLTNNSGSPVPGGVYMYRATLHAPDGKAETKTKKIIVAGQ